MELEQAVQVLCDAEVDFIIVGSVAAMIHGSSYVTMVLEIYYSRATANIKRLEEALAPFHPRPRGFPDDLPFVWDEASIRNSTVLTLKTDLGDVDLLAEVAGLGTYEEIKARSKITEAFDRRVALLDLRSLIHAKRAAGRNKDLLVLPELESLLESEEKE
jgi:hypothetical protein